MLGMLGFLVFNNECLLLISAFFFGAQDSCSAVFLPLLVRQRFGTRNYARVFSWVSVGSGVVGSFGSRFVGYSYDVLASFSPAFVLGVFLCLMNVVFVFCSQSTFRPKKA